MEARKQSVMVFVTMASGDIFNFTPQNDCFSVSSSLKLLDLSRTNPPFLIVEIIKKQHVLNGGFSCVHLFATFL